jgi:hypothetical protein
MANKLKNKKPVVKTPAEPTTENKRDTTNASDDQAPKEVVFNAETAQVLRDTAAGKNLTRYVDEDDLFKKLGIKIGKA